jgi:tetratricopeptide (TPR) repeat protein
MSFPSMVSRNTRNTEAERRLTAELLNVCANAAMRANAHFGVGAMRSPLRQLLILHPANPKVLGIFITALANLEEAGPAREWSARAYRVLPGSMEVAAASAQTTLQFADPGDSREIWRKLVNADPLRESYRLGLAQALEEAGAVAEAIEQLRRHLVLNPNTAIAHVLLARGLQHEGARPTGRQAGRRILARARASAPRDQVNRVNIAWHRLREAPDDPLSWEKFGARWGGSPYLEPVNGVVMPSWRGPGDSARKLIIRQELGLGDQVLFAHFLPALERLALTGAMVCAPRLRRLFARSFPNWKIVGDPTELVVGEFDAQIFAGDLGQHLTGSRQSGYLVADRQRVAMNRRRYLNLGFKRLIGFAWRGGNMTTAEERRRAIPLSDFSRLFGNREIGFVCLQHGVTEAERDQLAAFSNVILDASIDPLKDLDDLAAQIASMDLVVTSASANTHFAAALGIRVLALLPSIAHWHWGLPGVVSPWYPTLEPIRQPQPGDWRSVLEEVGRRLTCFMENAPG